MTSAGNMAVGRHGSRFERVEGGHQYDRQPPYAPEAEVSVLGAMLIDGEAIPVALEIVDDGMFYREAHRRIFRAMLNLHSKGVVIDATTLREHLSDSGELESVGGIVYIAELLDAAITGANIAHHAQIVRNRWQRRKGIEAYSEGIRLLYEPEDRGIPEIVDRVDQLVSQCAVNPTGAEWIKHILYPTFQHIEELQAAKGGITGLSTGLVDLDEMTGGLQKGDLIIVAARPSMGKTAFVTGLGLHAAISTKTPVAFFSLEMSKRQLVQRMLCSEALVDLSRLLRGRLADDDFGRLAQAASHLNTSPMWIDDDGGVSVTTIRATARKLKKEQNIGLVIVDYLQLMEGSANAENRNLELGQITRGLKMLAKELDLPVICLSQLSRQPEQRSNHRPQLSDLRESGSIEQDADIVMFLYRPEYYATREEAQEQGLQGKAELIFGKHRNGPVGTVDLFFRAECARFESFTKHWGNR